MEYLKTEALTLKCRDQRESSQLVTFYTRDYGKVNVLARGIYRPRTDLEGPFDLLEYTQIVYLNNPMKQTSLLVNNKIYDNFPPLHEDYERVKYGLAVVEFLDNITPWEDPNPDLFQIALGTIKEIAHDGRNLNLVLSAFLVRALKNLGYLPYPEGGAEYLARHLAPADARGIFALIRNLLAAKIPIPHLRIPPEMAGKLYRFLTDYITHLVGYKLKVEWYETQDLPGPASLSRAVAR